MDKTQKKALNASLIVIAIFAVLILRLIYLQVFEYRRLGSISDANSLRRVWLQPPRGRMIDRNGIVVVDNQPLYTIKAMPAEFSDSLKKDVLADLIDITYEDLDQKIDKGFKYNRFAPTSVRRDIEPHEMMRISENLWMLPGVMIEMENKRKYPLDLEGSHVFGYLNYLSKGDLEKMADKGYTPDDKTGSKGLEKQYEETLRGQKGVRFELVNSIGKTVGKFDEGQKDLPFVKGDDIYLTLDSGLQKLAEGLLIETEKSGAVVAIDPQDGGILAMASVPDYDLEILNGKTDAEQWKQIVRNPKKPLFNRAIQAAYPPGSVYKLVLAIAGLEEKAISPKKKIYCSGVFRLGRGRYRCHGGAGLGMVDLEKSIVKSCNTYYYKLIFDVGFEQWTRYGRMFGFGEPTGIDLPGERSWPLPSVEYYNERYGKGKWSKGNLVSLSIGQGELNTTPIQLASFTATIANKGTLYQPHIVKGYKPAGSDSLETVAYAQKKLPISENTFDLVRNAMYGAVEQGTGKLSAVQGVKVAGKTGTAQNPHGDNHAWFVAFAPLENPTIALAVLVENAGYGGSVSAPIAGKLIDYYINGPDTTAVDSTITIETDGGSTPVDTVSAYRGITFSPLADTTSTPENSGNAITDTEADDL